MTGGLPAAKNEAAVQVRAYPRRVEKENTTMAAYLIAHVDVTDTSGYAEYRRLVPAVIGAYCGRILAGGGATEVLEGQFAPKRFVIVEFPDMTSLRAFYQSQEYQALATIRQHTTRSVLLAVDGI